MAECYSRASVDKMRKSEFKELVRECLIEILQEGALVGRPSVLETSKKQKKEVRPRRRAPIQSVQENVQRRSHPTLDAPANPRFNNALDTAVAGVNAGGDPILDDILRDTAMTTLQEQMTQPGEKSAAALMTDVGMSRSEGIPVDPLPGSNNWAALAFMDSDPE